KELADKLIPENSIAVVTRVGVGKVSLVSFEYSTSQDFLSLSKLLVDKWFATYLLYYKLQNELLSLQGTSIKGITKKELLAKKVQISNDQQEQVLIGQLINLLDDTIELHQRKINILLKAKQNFMIYLFPLRENLFPKLRLSGFHLAWEQCKLNEILKVNNGKDYKHLSNGDIAVYGTGGYMLSVDDKLSDVDGIGIGRKGTIDKPQFL